MPKTHSAASAFSARRRRRHEPVEADHPKAVARLVSTNPPRRGILSSRRAPGFSPEQHAATPIHPSPTSLPVAACPGVPLGLARRRWRPEPRGAPRLRGVSRVPVLGRDRLQLVLRPRRWAGRRTGASAGCAAEPAGVLGAMSAALLILALYPLTQLYQVDEDARRGDRTLAVAWGVHHCFVFSAACTVLGGAAMLALVVRRFGALDAAVVALGVAGQV